MPSLRLVPKNSEEMRFQGCPFGTEIFFLFFLFFPPRIAEVGNVRWEKMC